MQAAIGRVQLEKLDKLMARRDDIYDAYKEAGFDLLDSEEADFKPVRQSAVMHCQNAQAVIAAIKEGCVECLQPVDLFDQSLQTACPRAAALSQATISLPIYPHLSNDEVREIVDLVCDALDANAGDHSDIADNAS
jgi:dTDP-4-amino-4,6-dideoxygalactose transaminase